MSIDIMEINGSHPEFDIARFEYTLKEALSGTCTDAKVFAFNNFPIPVSSEANIDLLLILAIDPRKGNYYRLRKDDKYIYVHNLIIPIRIVTQLRSVDLETTPQHLPSSEGLIDYASEISAIRFNLGNYLVDKCGFHKDKLYIQPLVYIVNPQEQVLDNYLIAPQLDFRTLKKYLSETSFDIFVAYKDWNTSGGYESIHRDVNAMVEQISADSMPGYLTRKKTERLGKQLGSTKSTYEEMNQNLLIIHGKAGTGKSTELLSLTMKCISEGKNALFLSYNKLLIYDIAKTIKSYLNLKNKDKTFGPPGDAAVITLHAFFYRLARSLGVLHVLSALQIDKAQSILEDRIKLVCQLLEPALKPENYDFKLLKTIIRNEPALHARTKEAGVDLMRYLEKRGIFAAAHLPQLSQEYCEWKRSALASIETHKTFITDYYTVLSNTLLIIQEPEVYFEQFQIREKYALLQNALHLANDPMEPLDNNGTITEKEFILLTLKHLEGHRRNRTVFIDEAQDCHRLEKDILISLYGSNNLVVANGGKDQLIRHTELCNWEVYQNKKIAFKKYYTRNKSYRIKRTVADFCNFVANKFGIDFNLEPQESEDDGELLFDFRQHHTDAEIKEIFNHLSLNGSMNGCTPYESLLVLLEPNSQRATATNTAGATDREHAIINEYGHLKAATAARGGWKYIPALEKHNQRFWDGTVDDKSQLVIPGPNESRVIYYESCRGLESWSVACFALDKFFLQKTEDTDAEKYLAEDLFLTEDVEERKRMFAATWALMAITRVIDTLYIQINDRESVFGKLVTEYLQLNPPNVRELKARHA